MSHRCDAGNPRPAEPAGSPAAGSWSTTRAGWLVIVVFSAASSACTVGPDYQRPAPPLPDSLNAEASEGEPLAETTAAGEPERKLVIDREAAWWRTFSGGPGEPDEAGEILGELVERAMRGNLDLEIALARVAEARALRRAQGGQLAPAADFSVTQGRSRASARGPGPLSELAEAGLASLENEIYTTGLGVSWEIDLFGRLRRAREASQARLEGAREDWRAAALLVAAETADAYITLRGVERRIALAERNLELQSDSLQVIVGKVEAGLLPALDGERSRAERASLEALLAPLHAQRSAARHRLAVLLGELPGALDDDPIVGEMGAADVPTPRFDVVLGEPARLVERRPDLRSAERALHAATAEVGVAIGDRLPRLSLGGSLGLESATLGDLLNSAAHTWSFGPRLDLPLFRGGALRAGVGAARARLQAADAAYRRGVLGALEEVRSALAALAASRAALEALREASAASGRATEYASVLYDEGLRDHLVLLDAQRAQTQADDALAIAEADVALRAVTLYRALGGGWADLERLALPGSTSEQESPAAPAAGEPDDSPTRFE